MFSTYRLQIWVHFKQATFYVHEFGTSWDRTRKSSSPGPWDTFTACMARFPAARCIAGFHHLLFFFFLNGAEEHYHGVVAPGSDLRIKDRWLAGGTESSFPSNEKKKKKNSFQGSRLSHDVNSTDSPTCGLWPSVLQGPYESMLELVLPDFRFRK